MPERPPPAPGSPWPRHPAAMLARHLLAIAVLPFTVTVLAPYWIAERWRVAPALGRSAGPLALQALGLALLGVGLVLLVASVWRFASEGRGTLAPWDPRPCSSSTGRTNSCATR